MRRRQNRMGIAAGRTLSLALTSAPFSKELDCSWLTVLGRPMQWSEPLRAGRGQLWADRRGAQQLCCLRGKRREGRRVWVG
jgi:hypothetical protein